MQPHFPIAFRFSNSTGSNILHWYDVYDIRTCIYIYIQCRKSVDPQFIRYTALYIQNISIIYFIFLSTHRYRTSVTGSKFMEIWE